MTMLILKNFAPAMSDSVASVVAFSELVKSEPTVDIRFD